jgi:hypothetical protein
MERVAANVSVKQGIKKALIGPLDKKNPSRRAGN